MQKTSYFDTRSQAREFAATVGGKVVDLNKIMRAEFSENRWAVEYDREKVIPLTVQDASMLVDLIDNPPEPNQKLKDAAARYAGLKQTGQRLTTAEADAALLEMTELARQEGFITEPLLGLEQGLKRVIAQEQFQKRFDNSRYLVSRRKREGKYQGKSFINGSHVRGYYRGQYGSINFSDVWKALS